ncbi:MAG: PilN domain-containing protein [Magnetococcales bacterium]|nr:PilN domain-containing protein [Magnetococcales bacterium]
MIEWIHRWLVPRVVHWDDEIRRLGLSGQGKRLDDTSVVRRSRLIVLGRHHYLETSRHYPIVNRQDLLAAIHLDMAELSPYPPTLGLYRVGLVDDEGSRVHFWFPKPEIQTTLGEEWSGWLLPESLLLALALTGGGKGCLVKRTGDFPYYIHGSAQGMLLSHPAVGLVTGEGIFRHLAGCADLPLTEISPNAIGGQLSQGLRALLATPPRDLTGLWAGGRKEREFDGAHYKRLLLVATAACGLYLAAGSAYLEQRREAAQNAVTAQTPTLERFAGIQRQWQDLHQRYTTLVQAVDETVPRWQLMQLLGETLGSMDVQLSFIRVNGNQVELRGATASASILLSRLESHPQVVEARFMGAIKKDHDGQEKFSTRFNLLPKRQEAK